jgi:flagellar basal-body rod protein FlgF
MDNLLYVSLSHQMVLRRQLDLIANNLANMNTTGYRRENVVFQQFLNDDTVQGGNRTSPPLSFVLDYGVARDESVGDMLPTGNPLDVAINGPGYFAVQNQGGETLYTRDGRFQRSGDGFVVTKDGHRVLGEGGQPMRVPPTVRFVQVAEDGTVTGDDAALGRMQVVKFNSELDLTRRGDNDFTGQGATPIPATEVKLRSGVIEGSNVKPVAEISEMIEVLRTYQSTTRLIDRYEDIRKRGIERLGRVQ